MYSCWRTQAAILALLCGPAIGKAPPPISILHTQPYVYTVNPAGEIHVNYRFKATAPTASARRVFVHFLDASGWTVHQDDHDPMASTTQWYGDIVYERVVKLPANMVSGYYRIAVGLFDPTTRGRTALQTVIDPASVEPTYTREDTPGSRRYIVGEVYVTTKPIVEAPFVCNGNDVTGALSQSLRNLSSGQVLKLPFGSCHYSGALGINAMRLDQKSNVEVVGQGAPSTRLVATDKLRSGFIVSRSSDILLRDFKIEVLRSAGLSERTGNPDATGVYSEHSTKVELRQLAIASPLAQGISLYRTTDSRVTRNFVKLAAADGIHVAGPSSNVVLDQNELFDVGDDALSSIGYSQGAYAGQNQNISIRHNRVRFRDVRWGSGVAVEGTAGAQVLGNYIERSGSAGIRIASIEGYALLSGVRYPFMTGAVTSVDVTGNELVDVETRADLHHGAIHIAAEAADVSNIQVIGNTISSASLAGTATDAIRVGGRVTPGAIHYARDIRVWSNAIRNITPGVLGDWCIVALGATTQNLSTQNTLTRTTSVNTYTSTGSSTARTAGTTTGVCTYRPTN